MRITADDSVVPPDDIRDDAAHRDGEYCHAEFGQAAIICDRPPDHSGEHYDAVDDIGWSEVD